MYYVLTAIQQAGRRLRSLYVAQSFERLFIRFRLCLVSSLGKTRTPKNLDIVVPSLLYSSSQDSAAVTQL